MLNYQGMHINLTWNCRGCFSLFAVCMLTNYQPLPLRSELTNNTLRKQRWVPFFSLKFECHNRYNKLLKCNSENGDVAQCNKNNFKMGAFRFSLRKNKNLFLFKKQKNIKKNKNGWVVFFLKKIQIFLKPSTHHNLVGGLVCL